MRLRRRPGPEKGLTLLEFLWVTIIIGILMAVIIPRAQRVRINAKYALVRQAATELGRWGTEWADRNLEAQEAGATCVLNDYVVTLGGYVGDPDGPNWIQVNDDLTDGGCRAGTTGVQMAVADLVPPESQPINPFNGLSYFNAGGGNSGDQVRSGLLYLAYNIRQENGQIVHYYYFVFTGTDSLQAGQWHSGMGNGFNPNIPWANLRNGVFMARLVAQ